MRIKGKARKRIIKNHRVERYEHALDRVINGTGYPASVTYRWNKIKQIGK